MIKINNQNIKNILLGSAPIKKVLINEVQVYPDNEPGYEDQYLTFEILNAGTITIKASNAYISRTISYSINNGSTWSDITSSTTEQSLGSFDVGDKILVKGSNNTYATTSYSNTFKGTAKVKLYGNIMSLIYGDNFKNQITFPTASSYNFNNLFNGYNNLVSIENLILPVTTLTSHCYEGLFNACTSLIDTCELPATTLAFSCYASIFGGCTNITTVPELPATTLATSCYASMFFGCTSLTTVPELPATTLATNCYTYMFQNCTNITTAPELLATTLASYCYMNMFYNCSSLTYIKCLAVDMSSSGCVLQWTNGVASSGTFVKHVNASWGSGGTGIPSNWSIIEVDPTDDTWINWYVQDDSGAPGQGTYYDDVDVAAQAIGYEDATDANSSAASLYTYTYNDKTYYLYESPTEDEPEPEEPEE